MARGSGGKDRTKPVITITSPSNLAQFTAGTTATINITATDNRAISYVNLRISDNSGIVGTITTNLVVAPYTYVWSIPNVTSIFTITATAYDTSSNSSLQSITVKSCVGGCSTTTTTTTIAPPPPPPVLPASKILAAPTPFIQGGEGSCASMAVALAASMTYYYHTNATSYSISTNIFSPEYLYNKAKFAGSCGIGSSNIQNLAIVKNEGCPRWSVCPYSAQPQGCQTLNTTNTASCDTCIITPTVEADAANYKTTYYGSVMATDLYTIKRLLANNYPIVAPATLDSNMNVSDPNYTFCTSGTTMAGHGFVVIGYDDARQAFLIQNSYGTNWANGGRFWVCYNKFSTHWGTCYWMTYRNDQNPFPIL